MKRLARSECLISMCPSGDSEESSGKKEGVYEEGAEKKRRLSVVQVKALEKKFEMENKLEPERKLRLAQELGLHPRQVAVWFQNRRARWKTKQLERDFRILKASYDSLQHNFDSLHQSNQLLLNQLRELKSKMNSENTENNLSITEEEEEATEAAAAAAAGSDSSAILNEGNSPNASTIGYLNLSESSAGEPLPPAQFVKMEEHDFFSEDTCNFYSEDQAPTLHWWT